MKIRGKTLVLMMLAGALALSNVSAFAKGIGVNEATANFMPREYALDAIERSRATWVRTSHDWTSISYTKNGDTYTLNASDLAETKAYLAQLKEKGNKVIFILEYGNTATQLGNTNKLKIPDASNDAYWKGWQEYVKTVATELKGLVDVYEVWNEQDHAPFNVDVSCSCNSETDPNATAVMEKYAALLKQTYQDVKTIDQDVIVTPGGWAHGDDYLDEFFTAVGTDKCFDAFAVHAYNHGNYSKIEDKFRGSLDEYEAALEKYGYTGDIFMTENGWYTGTDANAVTEKQQAAALVRNKVIWDDYLQDNSRGGEYIWYTAIDTGNNASYSEHNYGLFDIRLNAKPSAKSAKALNAFIADKKFVSLAKSSTGTFTKKYTYKATYKNEDTGSITYIVWGDGTTANITGGTVYNMDGTLSGEASTSISLSDDNPKFVNVDGSGASITEAIYNKETNTIKVSGRVYGTHNNVELYARLQGTEDREAVTVLTDEFGYFYGEISAPTKGEIMVSTNYGGSKQVTADGEFADDANKSSITAATAMYNSTRNLVTVSAALADCEADETLKVLVAGATATKVTKDNIVYIDEIRLANNANVQITFALPADTAKGKYNVYLSLTNSDKVSDTIYNNLVEVGSFVYGTEGNKITATARDIGYDEGLVSEAVIIIAQYDDQGCLVTVSVSDAGISSNEKSHQAPVAEGVAEIKAFLWKDTESLIPLADVAIPQ